MVVDEREIITIRWTSAALNRCGHAAMAEVAHYLSFHPVQFPYTEQCIV